jgi:hypothetical protein
VLRADVALLHLERFPQRELEDLLGPGRERDVADGAAPLASSDDRLDVAADPAQPDAEEAQRPPRRAVRFAEKTEEDVLGADVRVVQPASLLLREDDGGSGRGREPFEHDARFAPLSMH